MSYVIGRPIVTEKNNLLAEKGIYIFEVNRRANKEAIKSHVEKYFDVKVKSVKTLICRTRPKKTRGGYGKVKYWKKAFVRLRTGEKINIFEGH